MYFTPVQEGFHLKPRRAMSALAFLAALARHRENANEEFKMADAYIAARPNLSHTHTHNLAHMCLIYITRAFIFRASVYVPLSVNTCDKYIYTGDQSCKYIHRAYALCIYTSVRYTPFQAPFHFTPLYIPLHPIYNIFLLLFACRLLYPLYVYTHIYQQLFQLGALKKPPSRKI